MADDILSVNLVPVDGSELEFFVDKNTGRAYASIRATARMLSRNVSTLTRYIGGRKIRLLEAQIQTSGGLQGVRMFSAEQVFDAALEYFHPLARQMGAYGANAYMLRESGYKHIDELPIPPVPPTLTQGSPPTDGLVLKTTKNRLREDLAVIEQAGRMLHNLPQDISTLAGKRISALEAGGLSYLLILAEQLRETHARLSTALEDDIVG
jgi:hypothetical protein